MDGMISLQLAVAVSGQYSILSSSFQSTLAVPHPFAMHSIRQHLLISSYLELNAFQSVEVNQF